MFGKPIQIDGMLTEEDYKRLQEEDRAFREQVLRNQRELIQAIKEQDPNYGF